MKKISALIEDLSGLASFWVGLIYLFIAVSMAFYIHNKADAILPGAIAVWSVALLAASRRAGYRIVIFRIVSVVILLVGTLAAALFLPMNKLQELNPC